MFMSSFPFVPIISQHVTNITSVIPSGEPAITVAHIDVVWNEFQNVRAPSQPNRGHCTVLHGNSRHHFTATVQKCMKYYKCRNDTIVHANHNSFWSPRKSWARVPKCLRPLQFVLNSAFAS